MNRNLFQKKEFLVGIGFLILNLAILIFGVWFLTSKIITTSQVLKEKRAALEGVYQGWQEMGHQQKELQEMKPQLDKINQAFLSLEQPVDFINLMESLAQKTNNLYQINLISQSAVAGKGSQPNALSFQVSLAGSFSNFMHFLRYLENMKYLIDIDSLETRETIGQGVTQKLEWKNIPAGSVSSIINLKVFTQ